MDINNLVIGENFKDFAQIVIDFTNYQNKRTYQKNNIVFCKTDLVLHLFNEISNLDVNIILITHQSDYEVNNNDPQIDVNGNLVIDWGRPAEGNTPALFKLRPKQIRKWFAQNVNYSHEDLIPLPLGLENHKGWSKGGSLDTDYISRLNSDDLYIPTKKITNKIYSNFGNTHINRENVRKFLLDNNLSDEDGEKLPYSQYMEEMRKYLFIASPRGNGIDTHRTWEALLMGSIPIVEKNPMYENYNLPIWQIESWEELNDKSKFDYWIDSYNKGQLFDNTEQLHMDYWKKRITEEYTKL